MPSIGFENRFRTLTNTLFSNWHETVNKQVRKRIVALNANPNKSTLINYHMTTQALKEVIAEAIQNGSEVRALGGAWSFSEVAATTGFLIDTWPLTYRFTVSRTQKHSSYAGSERDLHFVQCGNSISSINKYLYKLDKSLKTTGASNGQTIAGAMSTGTHGSAIEVGAIQDYIRSIHLITSPTKSVWLERKSAPAISDIFARKFADKIKRDDSLFNAALVSFGSFGIIHGVVIESTDLFYLHTSRSFIDFDEEMWKAITTLDFSGIKRPIQDRNPYHFKVVIDPNKRDKVSAEMMYKYSMDEPIPACDDAEPAARSGQADEVFTLLAAVTDIVGATKDIISGLFRSFYKEISGVCGTIGETFSDTTTRGKAFSTAMGIPLERVREALNIVFDEYDKDWAPAIVSLRFVRSSQATFAFTAYSPTTCILEIDGPRSNKVQDLAARVWKKLDDNKIPYTFHWGKINNLSAKNINSRFESTKINDWQKARRTLLDSDELRAVFANDFLRTLQLHN